MTKQEKILTALESEGECTRARLLEVAQPTSIEALSRVLQLMVARKVIQRSRPGVYMKAPSITPSGLPE